MKNVLKILCAALLVAATVFTFASCATIDGMKQDVKDFLKDHEEEIVDEFKDEEAAAFRFNLLNSASLTLCSAEAENVVATEETPAHLEKTLTATVYPEDTPFSALAWSVYWQDENAADVAEYITIQENENAHSVVVSCWQQFEGVICIEVAAKDYPSIKAVCEVTYVGIPSSMYAVNEEGVKLSTASKLDVMAYMEPFSFVYYGSNALDDEIELEELEVTFEFVSGSFAYGTEMGGATYTLEELKNDTEVYEAILNHIDVRVRDLPDGSLTVEFIFDVRTDEVLQGTDVYLASITAVAKAVVSVPGTDLQFIHHFNIYDNVDVSLSDSTLTF